jgi:hypothetical protein
MPYKRKAFPRTCSRCGRPASEDAPGVVLYEDLTPGGVNRIEHVDCSSFARSEEKRKPSRDWLSTGKEKPAWRL